MHPAIVICTLSLPLPVYWVQSDAMRVPHVTTLRLALTVCSRGLSGGLHEVCSDVASQLRFGKALALPSGCGPLLNLPGLVYHPSHFEYDVP